MKGVLNKTKAFLLEHTLVTSTSALFCVSQQALFSPASIQNRRVKSLKADKVKRSNKAVSCFPKINAKLPSSSLSPTHQKYLIKNTTSQGKVWKKVPTPPSTGIANRIDYGVLLI